MNKNTSYKRLVDLTWNYYKHNIFSFVFLSSPIYTCAICTLSTKFISIVAKCVLYKCYMNTNARVCNYVVGIISRIQVVSNTFYVVIKILIGISYSPIYLR
jgi:hypothetical protein